MNTFVTFLSVHSSFIKENAHNESKCIRRVRRMKFCAVG
jgi:hypothetical protein